MPFLLGQKQSALAAQAICDRMSSMATVDPDDDTINRFVVVQYRVDPDRNQRRHVAAACHNAEEGMAELEQLGIELAQQKAAGLAEDREWISGELKEPGYRERMRRMRRGEEPHSHWVVGRSRFAGESACPDQAARIDAAGRRAASVSAHDRGRFDRRALPHRSTIAVCMSRRWSR